MLSFFVSKKSKIDRMRLRNWLAVAFANGKFDESEQRAVVAFAAKHEISKKDFDLVLSDPSIAQGVDLGSPEAVIGHVVELIVVMHADGTLDTSEMDVVKVLASKMGVPPSVVDQLSAQIHQVFGGQEDGKVDIDEREIGKYMKE
jgi:uncharacterized tellurite resistance protein B-like protein